MAGSTQRGGSEKGGSKGEGREGRKRDGATVLCFHLGVMIPRWAAGGEQTTVRVSTNKRKERGRKKKRATACHEKESTQYGCIIPLAASISISFSLHLSWRFGHDEMRCL